MIHNSFRRIALAQGLLPQRPFVSDLPQTEQGQTSPESRREMSSSDGRGADEFRCRSPEHAIQV